MSQLKERILLNGVFALSDMKYKTHISSWYRKVGQMCEWTPEQIKSWQTQKLQALIQDAYQYSVYYHRLFDSLGIKPGDIRTAEDLQALPPLTKEIVQEHYDEILLHGKPGLHFMHRKTGGSTGNPSRYVKDNNSWGFMNAFNIWLWKETGYCYGDTFLALGSSSLFPKDTKSRVHDIFYKLKGKIPFNAMNMSDEVCQECVDCIIRNKVHYIYGYASSLFLLACYIREHHLESKIRIHACFPTSEILTDTYRQTIEEVFHCTVCDIYGAHDGGMIAGKIDHGYKVSYNCLVQTDGTLEDGAALLTDVTSTAFPMIRYQLGDILSLGHGYDDYFNGQVLDKVVGRTSDLIRLENGRVLTGPGFTILFRGISIKGYRIYKSAPMELTVEMVKLPSYTLQEEQLIRDTMQKHAGQDCKIVIRYKDQIETRKNGKNLYFLNSNVES